MATKKAAIRKATTFSKTVKKPVRKASQRDAGGAPARRATTPRKAPSGVFDYFRFGESYTSLILGMVVVIIATILLVAFFRNRSIQEVNPRQDISATNISPTQQKTYIVKEGDTLWSIAESQLNDGYRWPEIMKANNITEAGTIEKGTRLTLPSATTQANIQASPSAAARAVQPTAVVTRAELSPTPQREDMVASVSPTQRPYFPNQAQNKADESTQGVTGGKITGQTYTVKEGDYLWDIAIRAYGDGYKWGEIATKNQLPNPDLIYVGSVLQLPR